MLTNKVLFKNLANPEKLETLPDVAEHTDLICNTILSVKHVGLILILVMFYI